MKKVKLERPIEIVIIVRSNYLKADKALIFRSYSQFVPQDLP